MRFSTGTSSLWRANRQPYRDPTMSDRVCGLPTLLRVVLLERYDFQRLWASPVPCIFAHSTSRFNYTSRQRAALGLPLLKKDVLLGVHRAILSKFPLRKCNRLSWL